MSKSREPNQKIKPVPLKPIPVMSELFSKEMIDCVGPLSKTKKQNLDCNVLFDEISRCLSLT